MEDVDCSSYETSYRVLVRRGRVILVTEIDILVDTRYKKTFKDSEVLMNLVALVFGHLTEEGLR